MPKFEEKTVTFIRTNKGDKGIPCLWENEKLFSDMTTIKRVLDDQGKSPSPYYISTKNNFCLIPIREGYLILKLFFEGTEKTKYAISLLRILEIDKYSNECRVEIIMRKNINDSEFIYNDDSVQLSSEVQQRIGEFIENLAINKS
jgi:hypothetical protein